MESNGDDGENSELTLVPANSPKSDYPSSRALEDTGEDEELWFDPDALAKASQIDWGPPDSATKADLEVQIQSFSRVDQPSLNDCETVCDLAFLPGIGFDKRFGAGWGLALSQIVGGVHPAQAIWFNDHRSEGAVSSDWMAQLVEGLAAARQEAINSDSGSDCRPSLLWVATKGYDAKLWRCKALARWTQTDWRMLFGGQAAARAFHIWTETEIDQAFERCLKRESEVARQFGRLLHVAEFDPKSLSRLAEIILDWLDRDTPDPLPRIVALPQSLTTWIAKGDQSKSFFLNLLTKVRNKKAILMIDRSPLSENDLRSFGVQLGDVVLDLHDRQGNIGDDSTEPVTSMFREVRVEARIYGQGELRAGKCNFRWHPEFGQVLSSEPPSST